jgi:hypothetical protein
MHCFLPQAIRGVMLASPDDLFPSDRIELVQRRVPTEVSSEALLTLYSYLSSSNRQNFLTGTVMCSNIFADFKNRFDSQQIS